MRVESTADIGRSFGLVTDLYQSEKQSDGRSQIRFNGNKLIGRRIDVLT